jgi:hypothetical protein
MRFIPANTVSFSAQIFVSKFQALPPQHHPLVLKLLQASTIPSSRGRPNANNAFTSLVQRVDPIRYGCTLAPTCLQVLLAAREPLSRNQLQQLRLVSDVRDLETLPGWKVLFYERDYLVGWASGVGLAWGLAGWKI